MPKTTNNKTKTSTKTSTKTKKEVLPPPLPVEEHVEEHVEEPVEEPVEDSVEDSVEEAVGGVESNDSTNSEDNLAQQFDVLTNSIKMLGDNLRTVLKVMKTLRSQVNKLEKAEFKRDQKRKNKGERKTNSNSGFQKKHNIAGTPLEEFLRENGDLKEDEEPMVSMVDAHKAICSYIKSRKDVPKFPGDERIIVMDDTLDKIFPGLMDNYPNAIKLANEAVETIENKKDRRAYLDEHISSDQVLTYSGIMKRLPYYFKKDVVEEV